MTKSGLRPYTHRKDPAALNGDASTALITAHFLDLLDARGLSDSNGQSRPSADALALAARTAESGYQRAALLRYVHELERQGKSEEDIVLACLGLRLKSFDPARPWKRKDFRGLLHKPGAVVADATDADEQAILDALKSEGPVPPATGKPVVESVRFRQEVQKEVHRLRVQEAARLERDELGWSAPAPGVSLADARLHPPAAPECVVEGILPEGFTIMAAQFKAGKTTLALNLADALASGQDFLGAYPVRFPEGSVVYWNLEVDEPLFFSWQDRIVKDDLAARRIITHHLRGAALNLLVPAHAEWAIRSLAEAGAQAWIIDPLGRLLENENDNSEFNRWFRAVERIRRLADLRMVFIPHHTGHAVPGREDAVPRGRGGSAQLGATDANLSYRHGGDLGGYPPDSRRYLSGFGRGVDLAEITLDFDAASLRLNAVGDAPGRAADREAGLADKAVTALALSDAERLNSSDLLAALTGSMAKRSAAVRAAVRSGLIVKEKDGRNTWYSLPADAGKKSVR